MVAQIEPRHFHLPCPGTKEYHREADVMLDATGERALPCPCSTSCGEEGNETSRSTTKCSTPNGTAEATSAKMSRRETMIASVWLWSAAPQFNASRN